jgi:DNA-binding NarL/FixJ family response regulator
MKRIDSVFGRLTAAWNPLVSKADKPGHAQTWRGLISPPTGAGSQWPSSTLPSGQSLPGARQGRVAPSPSTEPALPPLVLLVTVPSDGPGHTPESALKAYQLALALGAGERLRCMVGTPFQSGDLEHLLNEFEPRLLLIDVALVERTPPEELRRLHRRRPATDWVMLWNEVSTFAFEQAVHAQMRGCIEWSAPVGHIERAVSAVMGGEIWFPRQAMQSLYLSLLAATQTHSTSGPMPLDKDTRPPADGESHSGTALTTRELQALALMRQGLSNKQIAERLDISVNTVKKHLAHAYEKRGLHNRRQSIA